MREHKKPLKPADEPGMWEWRKYVRSRGPAKLYEWNFARRGTVERWCRAAFARLTAFRKTAK